jgi:uncharacterized OB-fold protein
MSTPKTRTPAAPGWFTLDEESPQLLGTRCAACGSTFFPREEAFCRNPACGGGELEEVPLSRRGRLWSFTNNCYPPPPPLADEKMVVLGQVVPGVDLAELEAGMEMELVLGTLFEDEEHEYLVWKWKPAA